MFGHDLNPHYFANPPAFTYVLHFLFALASAARGGVRHAFALPPRRGLHARARRRRACSATLALWLLYLRRRAPVRPRRRAARGGDRGGRVPAGLLLAPGAQRRADAGAADAVAARQRRRAAQGRLRDYALAGVGPRARLRDQVHGRDRARAAARGRRRAPARRRPGAPAPPRRSRGLALGRARRALARASSSPTPSRCSTTTPSTPNSSTSRALSAEAQGKLGRAEAGRLRLLPVVADAGGSAGCRRWRRSAARSRSGAASARARLAARARAASLFLAVHGHCRAATSAAG